jgi:hypothetical protein
MRDWIYRRQFCAISKTNLQDININNLNVIINKVTSVKLEEKGIYVYVT